MWGGTPRFFTFQDTATLSANMAEPFAAAIGDSPCSSLCHRLLASSVLWILAILLGVWWHFHLMCIS